MRKMLVMRDEVQCDCGEWLMEVYRVIDEDGGFVKDECPNCGTILPDPSDQELKDARRDLEFAKNGPPEETFEEGR